MIIRCDKDLFGEVLRRQERSIKRKNGPLKVAEHENGVGNLSKVNVRAMLGEAKIYLLLCIPSEWYECCDIAHFLYIVQSWMPSIPGII